MVVCKFFQQGNCRFGNNCRFDHIYGSKYSYRAPQLQSARSGHDNFTNSSELELRNTASSVFRSAVRNASTYQNASSHTFLQTHPQKPSVFDRLGPQMNVISNQNNQAKSIFAQANKNVFGPTQPAANVFQTQSNAKSLFAQATQSIFGQHQPPNEYFVAEQQKTLPNSSNTGNVFRRNNSPTSNVFSTNTFDQIVKDKDDGIYSKMEELSQSDIEAFQNADFKIGFIPELPPPTTLCL